MNVEVRENRKRYGPQGKKGEKERFTPSAGEKPQN
jgi:hypothetical protein